jgi:tetratricopeptide (TPR) repeat protein
VSLFKRRVNYDRKLLLAEAERARAKGRRRRAIALYRRVLAVEPRNLQLNARLAPLLAQTRQYFDAWQSFRWVAAAHMSNKQAGEALAVYRQAVRCLPRQIEAWQGVAEIERRQGRLEQAREALLRGRRQFRRRRDRPEAIALLRAAREIEPWDADTVLDLARLLARSRQAPEAQWLLEQFVTRSSGRQLQQVRGLQWRIEPSLRHTWYWLRAAVAALRSTERPVPA